MAKMQIIARATTPYRYTSRASPITCASSKSECCVGGGGWGVNGRCTASFKQGSCWFAGVLCERLLLSLGLVSEDSSQSLSKTPWKKKRPDINIQYTQTIYINYLPYIFSFWGSLTKMIWSTISLAKFSNNLLNPSDSFRCPSWWNIITMFVSTPSLS